MTLHIHLRSLQTPQAKLLQNLYLDVPNGVIHTVMGASGSGKSSLLSAICGTLHEGLSFDGEIALDGQRIDHLPTERRQIGILFQEDLLFAHMTVRENLLFAVPPAPQLPTRDHKSAREAKVSAGLQDIDMAAFADADPATLSGGQRARVALMRALLAEPRALLLDEPFSKLDATLRGRLRKFVFALVTERQLPVLLVTHDAADIADPAHLTDLTQL